MTSDLRCERHNLLCIGPGRRVDLLFFMIESIVFYRIRGVAPEANGIDRKTSRAYLELFFGNSTLMIDQYLDIFEPADIRFLRREGQIEQDYLLCMLMSQME